MLCTLNFHSAVCQSYLIKLAEKKGCNIFPSKFMNALMQKSQFSQTKVEHFRRLMTIQQMIRAGNQARLHEGEKGDRLVN